MTTEESQAALDRIRKLPWSAQFHKTLDNPTAPGGKVDMYLLIDDDSGAGIVSLAVPHGEQWIAEYVATCCADPYFVRGHPKGEPQLAIAFNRALAPYRQKDGSVDAREVFVAAMVMIEAYVGDMPKRSRQELIDRAMAQLSAIRNRE